LSSRRWVSPSAGHRPNSRCKKRGQLRRDHFGGLRKPVGQRRDEAGRIPYRESKCPGTDVALPQRDDHGRIERVGGYPHAANRAPGVVEPHSVTVEVPLLNHLSIIAPELPLGYWGSPGPIRTSLGRQSMPSGNDRWVMTGVTGPELIVGRWQGESISASSDR
jgi:hypothetical protein